MIKKTYLQKSIKIYKVYGYGILFLLFSILLIKPLLPEQSFIADFLIALPILIMIILAPLGLYYCFKSYRNKETSSLTLLKYTIGHLFFTLIVVFFIISIIKDISDAFA
jgi:hypothetical protein